jgi:DNA-binding response OmpR family regulator
MTHAVLVIEDERQLAKNIQTYLKRLGFDVRKSGNAAEGLKEFESFKPDVVLLDVMLPDVDGLQVLKRLRSLDSRAKVIMMTGAANRAIKPEAMKAGAYEFLTKPLSLRALASLLERSLT